MELQRPLWALNQAFAKYNLAACIKGALDLQGYAVGAPLPPQSPLAAEALKDVKRTLTTIGALKFVSRHCISSLGRVMQSVSFN